MSIRLEPVGPKDGELRCGQVVRAQDAEADRVVDVVVDVRDAVDDPNDPPLERLGLVLAGVLEDPVAHLPGQVQLLGDAERLLVVAKATPESLPHALVEGLLARVAERRVAGVVPEADRLGQVLVELQRAGDAAGDRGRLQRVRHAGAVVVAGGVDEDLRLPLEAAEGLRVEQPVAVALERGAHPARLLVPDSPARLVRPDGERRQPALLVLAHALLEGVRNQSGELRHGPRVVAHPVVDRAAKPAGRDRARGAFPIPNPLPPGASGGASNATALLVTGVCRLRVELGTLRPQVTR